MLLTFEPFFQLASVRFEEHSPSYTISLEFADVHGRIFLNLSSCQWKTLRGGASNERQLSWNVVICELKLALKSLMVWNTWRVFITLYIQLNLIFDPSSEYLEWAYSYFTPPLLIFFLVPFLHISFSIVCYKDKEHLIIQFIFTATLWRGPRGKDIVGLLLFSNPVSDLPISDSWSLASPCPLLYATYQCIPNPS